MIAHPERQQIVNDFILAVRQGARKDKAAEIIGLSLRCLQRWQKPEHIPEDKRCQRVFVPRNRLGDDERQKVLTLANQDDFKDKTPHQIVPILADRGLYVASESTWYRILKAAGQLSHRHNSQPRTVTKPKALIANAPKQVFSWDITYLATPVQGQYYYLYLVMDVFSRMIVGWQVYECESSELAADLMTDIYHNQGLMPGQATLHSDNGAPMKGATLLATLQRLGVAPSKSRPSVSNDNPYSESLFKTMKYNHIYPSQPFATIKDARAWVGVFAQWYNHEHRHSGIQFVTPAQRHHGEDKTILARRHAVYQQAKAEHPERWMGETRDWEWQHEVALNPEKLNMNVRQ